MLRMAKACLKAGRAMLVFYGWQQLAVTITAALIVRVGGELIFFAGTWLSNLIPDTGKCFCDSSFFH